MNICCVPCRLRVGLPQTLRFHVEQRLQPRAASGQHQPLPVPAPPPADALPVQSGGRQPGRGKASVTKAASVSSWSLFLTVRPSSPRSACPRPPGPCPGSSPPSGWGSATATWPGLRSLTPSTSTATPNPPCASTATGCSKASSDRGCSAQVERGGGGSGVNVPTFRSCYEEQVNRFLLRLQI